LAVSLIEFPSDIIAEIVYGHSSTIDGHRFAAEFDRRRKLADKGISEPPASGSSSFSTSGDKASGWSEVAKKGPPKEELNSGFKTVPAKKGKGKK
jgi:PERQ amino acid-rich with GYF domain-containing protein